MMAEPIGEAGRAARDLARRRLSTQPVRPMPPAALAAQPEAPGGEPPQASPADGRNERERPAIPVEQVAERVYRLLLRELALERERRGRL